MTTVRFKRGDTLLINCLDTAGDMTGTTVEAASYILASGDKTLSATLDRVRITSSGSDTFDEGSINIAYTRNG